MSSSNQSQTPTPLQLLSDLLSTYAQAQSPNPAAVSMMSESRVLSALTSGPPTPSSATATATRQPSPSRMPNAPPPPGAHREGDAPDCPSDVHTLVLAPAAHVLPPLATDVSLPIPIDPDSASSPSTAGKPRRRRNRIILSCIPCHDRKQQCDRGRPCKRCSLRGARQECYYESAPPKHARSSSSHGSLQDPAVPQPSLPVQVQPPVLTNLAALLQLVHAHNSQNAQISEGPIPMDQAVQVAVTALDRLSQQPSQIGQRVPPSEGSAPGVPTDNILVYPNNESPIAHAALSSLRSQFPNHVITNHLIFNYFVHSSVHWLYPIISKMEFDEAYHMFSSASSLDFVSLLALVCSISMQFMSQTSNEASIFAQYKPGKQVLQQRLYEFAKTIILNGTHLQPSLECARSFIILSLYELSTGSLVAYQNTIALAIRMGQLLSLHRKSKPSATSREVDDMRSNLWWTLFALDRSQSWLLRQPYMISEHHCDIPCPEMQASPSDIFSGSNDALSPHAFKWLQFRLARLTGRVLDGCFFLKQPSYQDVLNYEVEIRRYRLDFPRDVWKGDACMALDSAIGNFQMCFLDLQAHHIHALLLRPFLLVGSSAQLSAPSHEIFIKHAQGACLSLCKRIVSCLCLLSRQSALATLSWPEFSIQLFDISVILLMVLLRRPLSCGPNDGDFDSEIRKWLSLCVEILQKFASASAVSASGSRNTVPTSIAGSALWCLENTLAGSPFAADLNLTQEDQRDQQQQQQESLQTGDPVNFEPSWVLSQPYPFLGERAGASTAQVQVQGTSINGSRLAIFETQFPDVRTICARDVDGLLRFLDRQTSAMAPDVEASRTVAM